MAATEIPSITEVMMKCLWTNELSEFFTRPLEKFPEDFWWSRGLVNMAMQAAELGWNDAQIYAIICDADDRWGKYRDRSDRDLQRSNIVEKARRKHPYSTTDINFAGLGKSTASEYAPQVVYTYGQFRALDIKVDFVFEDLFAANGYGIIFGQSGVGKTQLLLQFGRSFALGHDFLDYVNVEHRPRKIMFFSLEMGPESLKHFTDNMERSLSEDEVKLLSDNLLVVPLGESMTLNEPRGQEFFKGLVAEHRPDMVIIDSLGTMRRGTLNDDASALELLEFIQQFKKAYNCGVVVVHHANKQGTSANLTLTDFFGSQYLYSGTDFVLGLAFKDKSEDSKDILQLTHVKNRLGPLRDPQYLLRTKYLTYESFNTAGWNKNASSNGAARGGSIDKIIGQFI